MIAYAVLTALKLKIGTRPFMETRHLEHLSYYFKNIDQVESLDKLCDEGLNYPWEKYHSNLPQLIESKDERTGKCIDYLDDVSLFFLQIFFYIFIDNIHFILGSFAGLQSEFATQMANSNGSL